MFFMELPPFNVCNPIIASADSDGKGNKKVLKPGKKPRKNPGLFALVFQFAAKPVLSIFITAKSVTLS